MKSTKIISVLSAAVLASCVLCTSAFAEKITMADAGYGVNGGKSFSPDGITAYSSTLGDLADKYDTIDFTISVADLGGRDDMSFQVYVAAGDWSVWANGLKEDEGTPSISEAGTEYSFSLNVDDIAEAHGRDLVICEMGFQVLSATPGDIDVTYTVNFSEESEETAASSSTAAEGSSDSTEASITGSTDKTTDDKGNADTGIEGVAAITAVAIISASAVLIARKRK